MQSESEASAFSDAERKADASAAPQNDSHGTSLVLNQCSKEVVKRMKEKM
jgi:hypothetical protein